MLPTVITISQYKRSSVTCQPSVCSTLWIQHGIGHVALGAAWCCRCAFNTWWVFECESWIWCFFYNLNLNNASASDGVRSRRDSTALPQPGVCGVSLADRIVGGTRTAINAYPWASLLMAQHKQGGQAIPFCGASLISDRFVLSAAHCFPEPTDSFIM